MAKTSHTLAIKRVLAALLLCVAPLSLFANAAELNVTNAHARETFALATTGAVYFTLVNQDESPIAITAVSVSTELAAAAQMHYTEIDGDIMKMRHAASPVVINPSQKFEFKPGGYHVMLIGLKAPLKAGDVFELTLTLDDGSQKQFPVMVSAEVKAHTHH